MPIVGPACEDGDDEMVSRHQCSADEDVDTGSLCSDTEALSVSEANHHRVSPAELVLPRSSTSLCTCKGVGADGRTTEERCSLRMPRRSSLRSSYASSYASSEDGSSSCGTSTSSKSERSVTFSDELQVASLTRPMPWARCPACTEAIRLDGPVKEKAQDEFTWWGLFSFSSGCTGGSNIDHHQQQQQSSPGKRGPGAKAPESPNGALNGNMKKNKQQEQEPCIKTSPVKTFKLYIDCAPRDDCLVTLSEAPQPSSAPSPAAAAAACARPPHHLHQPQERHPAALRKSSGGRKGRGRLTMMNVLGSFAEDLTAHRKGEDDRDAKIRRRRSLFL